MWLHKIADKYGYRLCVDLSKDVKRKKKEMKKKRENDGLGFCLKAHPKAH